MREREKLSKGGGEPDKMGGGLQHAQEGGKEGVRREWGYRETERQSESANSDHNHCLFEKTTPLNFRRWWSGTRWRSSAYTPPHLPLRLPEVLHVSAPYDQATLGHLDRHAWCLEDQVWTWILSDLITCPCVSWQMSPTRSWLWKPWRSWTGVWTSWRPSRPTGLSVTWPPTR